MENFEQKKAAVLRDLNANLKQTRVDHILGVADTAKSLAELYSIDVQDAEIAGLLHDNAKFMGIEELLSTCGEDCGRYGLASEHEPVLHAFAGARRAEEMYPGLSADVLNAIRFHTTGRPAMSRLEMLIFIADYIEPGRKPFEGLAEARAYARKSLEACTLFILENTSSYLEAARRPVHPLNREASHFYRTFCSVKG